MNESPLPVVPIKEHQNLLRKKFYEHIAAQSEMMDKLGGQLLTLELAIPGLYATTLKLVGGGDATVHTNTAFYVTFGCWFLALALTLISLFPKKWEVDPTILKKDLASNAKVLGIEDFFYRSARYKLRFLVASSALFFAGIICAAYTISP